jgi:hypothetical protein
MTENMDGRHSEPQDEGCRMHSLPDPLVLRPEDEQFDSAPEKHNRQKDQDRGGEP